MQTFKTFDEYFEACDPKVLPILKKIRKVIQENAPEATETISYGMPTFKLKNKPLVYFAAWPSHIGFYALPSGNIAFAKELANYKQGKGSIQFPLSEPMPYDLIAKIVKFRVAEVTGL